MSSLNAKSQDNGGIESSPQLPDVIDPAVAVDSVKSQRGPLINLISHCLPSLANSLLAEFIIPEDIYKKACNPHLEDSVKSGALLDCVEARIRLKASCFATFIDIVKSEPFLSDLAEELVQRYCSLSSLPPAEQPTIISLYANYFKRIYRNSPISSDSKWPPTPSKKYINLATAEHCHACRDEFIGEILRGNIKEVLKSRKKISIDEILLEDDIAYLKLILIEGAPGIGKSTLAWELCRRWEQGLMGKYCLTVLLRLREKKVQEIKSIPELFCSFGGDEDIRKDSIKEITSNDGEAVLLILDGFDELPTNLQKEGFLIELIKGTFLPQCTVLVTSRPSASAKLFTICRPQIQKYIEILGFTQESVEEYATSIFSSEPERLQQFKVFISPAENPAINSLMYVPLNAAIIVEIYRDSKSDHLLPRTLTQVYTQLCLTILNRYLESNSPLVALANKFKDLPGHLYQEFLKLSEVAFDGMKRQEVIFHTLPSDLVHFGFLDTVSSLYGGGSVSYNFLHLTLQEFFAAYHISQLCGDARLALLKECGSDGCWNVVWRFVAGLTEFKFFEGRHLSSDLFVEECKENVVKVKQLFIQCLFEAGIKMNGSNLFGPKKIGVYYVESTPLDLYALGYCIANLTSEVSWNIKMRNSDSIDSLFSGLKTSSTASSNDSINKLCIQEVPCNIPPDLDSFFPLCGITDLTLGNHVFSSSDNDFFKILTSLKRLRIINSTFRELDNNFFRDDVDVNFHKRGHNFIQQLSQSNVTSLDLRGTDLTKFAPALLHPLIKPQTGTLEELCVSGYASFWQLEIGRSGIYDDTSLLEMVCAPSSLKSLTLVCPQKIPPLTQLKANTCLTKLTISTGDEAFTGCCTEENLDVIGGILKQNKTLEHLIMIIKTYRLRHTPDDLKKTCIIAFSENDTLRSIKIQHWNSIIFIRE